MMPDANPQKLGLTATLVIGLAIALLAADVIWYARKYSENSASRKSMACLKSFAWMAAGTS